MRKLLKTFMFFFLAGWTLNRIFGDRRGSDDFGRPSRGHDEMDSRDWIDRAIAELRRYQRRGSVR